MNTRKKLPLFTSNFKEMIEDNYIYIDKTKYIYPLVKEKGYYFLSRPRRFGKSLLASTLKELFLGRKELFKDLWIGSSDYEWQEYPVIYLDFSAIDHKTVHELEINLAWRLKQIAQEYAIDISRAPSSGSMLVELVIALSKRNKVAILVDEYDKPILDHLHNIEEAQKQREALRNFYGTIKGIDSYLRAVFLTGVSRFSKTSLFSGINNLHDLSVRPEAATLVGYTQEEILSYFGDYIDDFAQATNKSSQVIMHSLKEWYNGYRFSKVNITVYNPFSVLYSLNDKEFSNYWYQSGTPFFLIHLIKKYPIALEVINNIEIQQDSLGNFNIENIPLIPLLFQTGYLTISDYNPTTERFKLNFPDREVELSFTRFLVTTLSEVPAVLVDTLSLQLSAALQRNNISQFCTILQTLFAHIPYTINDESYYHVLLQFLLSLLSLEAQSELLTNQGRIDLVISTKTQTFIFELKVNASPNIALKQIKDRKYYERFLHQEKQVILVGLAFNHVDKKLHIEHIEEIQS